MPIDLAGPNTCQMRGFVHNFFLNNSKENKLFFCWSFELRILFEWLHCGSEEAALTKDTCFFFCVCFVVGGAGVGSVCFILFFDIYLLGGKVAFRHLKIIKF